MAMVLVDLKKIVQAETGAPPVDCVITVPSYFNDAQVRAGIEDYEVRDCCLEHSCTLEHASIPENNNNMLNKKVVPLLSMKLQNGRAKSRA
jgi:molecular chaperone DnaK (HSP70)